MKHDPEITKKAETFTKPMSAEDRLVHRIVEGFETALDISLSEEEKKQFADYWKERRL